MYLVRVFNQLLGPMMLALAIIISAQAYGIFVDHFLFNSVYPGGKAWISFSVVA